MFNKKLEDITEEVFENSAVRLIADINMHQLQNKVSIIIYPRLTQYMRSNAYVPFKYKGVRIVLLNKHNNNHEYGAICDIARSIFC